MDTGVLSRKGWLAGQPESFRASILGAGQPRLFARGATIYAQGDDPGGIYGILDGSVAITIAPGRSGPHLAHLATPGAWFGEGAFLTGEPRRVGLEAASECALFHVPLDAMERLASADPANVRRFGQNAMLNIDIALQVIDDLLIRDSDRRVAAILLRSLGGRPDGGVQLTQEDLGRLANASRKVVNRALQRFAERGWVKPGYSTMEVVDPASLRRFATLDNP